MRTVILLLLGTLLFSCHNEPAADGRQTTRYPELKTASDDVPMKTSPGLESPNLQFLTEGQKVSELGPISSYLEVMEINHVMVEAPWLRVADEKGRKGWIFAYFLAPVSGDAGEWLMKKRIMATLGKNLALALDTWREKVVSSQNQQEVKERFEEFVNLKNAISEKLAAAPTLVPGNYSPDYQWLQDLAPGIVLQWQTPGRPPKIYHDYRYWLNLAIASEGRADDAYFQLMCSLFPVDSTESDFPSWKMPLNASSSASRLGEGRHTAIFRQIDQAAARDTLFLPMLTQLKNALMEDIAGKNTVYWQSATSIRAELDSLLQTVPACLDERDRLSLFEKRRMFDAPDQNGLTTDLRSGK